MKMHIREFAKLAGVTVRTLHYYDEIGLLKPSFVDEQNGYAFTMRKISSVCRRYSFIVSLIFP